ncbi:dynamin family protein [Telmatocola sphagniphila]|uniref:Dynamin family protein n=1 Tax=Telmatocola sphagniphila TaxID=1123043 RepID=A0A8E6B9Q2_9BACT|nr:dynamin family protein [Telmatocola sphagniphila]QVL33864.1 dynamin family protein [Telmatocola sphagniphila]
MSKPHESESVPSNANLGNDPEKLISWFQSDVKPFLENIQPEKVGPLEADAHNLEAVAQTADQELTVCFLGNAGVGKSTLINSLVAGKDVILPAGGIGPLTAQALAVRYAPQRRFEVEYHPPQNLWQLTFALESVLQREARRDRSVSGEDELKQESGNETRTESELGAVSGPQLGKTLEELKRQAQLLVTGDQDQQTDLDYLVDTLREATANKRIWGTTPRPEDEARVRQIREALSWASETGKPCTFTAEDAGFQAALGHHASGFLAPLIKELRVYWDSPLLSEGVTLVDLPGVGIVNDVYEATTSKWIRERARAVILVVETRGLNATHAELLRSSGFLNRLLYAADDPTADPVVLMVVVVKGDLVAEEEYIKDRSRKKREHFADVRSKSIEHIRHQLRSQLEEVWASDDVTRERTRKGVIETILAGLQVHPVSAPQYRKLLEADEDDRAFISESHQSGIPGLVAGLTDLARSQRQAQALRLREVGGDFFQRVLATVRVNQAKWREEARASQEAERLRSELDEFLEPLRREFHARQGAFREFLRETLPSNIRELVEKAKGQSSRDIEKYLNTLQDAHWATLRAAVRKGGAFDGARNINLPLDFAIRFEEPIAEVWGKSVLKEIRGRTQQFARDCVTFVDQVVEWAKKQGARVQTQLVLAQREEIIADAKRLEAVGREMVNELRDQVKNTLIRKVEGPIRKKCEKFVKDNEDRGSGVKVRILGLFNQLARDATEAASVPAIEILTAQFREVEKEILVVFEQHTDPLTSAADSIVASHELRVKRSDAQKRKKVLADVDAVLTACPWPLPAETSNEGGGQ